MICFEILVFVLGNYTGLESCILRSTLSNLALRSGESLGVGRLAFASASITKRSAASPVSTGIDFIAIAIS